jgi:hypothetical protein
MAGPLNSRNLQPPTRGNLSLRQLPLSLTSHIERETPRGIREDIKTPAGEFLTINSQLPLYLTAGNCPNPAPFSDP